jgi:formiminotetrahydrofolate cyclodeaminase
MIGGGLPDTGPTASLTVGELVELMAGEAPAPAAGTAAAVAAAAASALVSRAARRSTESWPEASGVAAQALVRRALLLARADSSADALVTALRAFETGAALEPPLRRTVDELLSVADGAADVAELAAATAEWGEGHVRAEAAAAAVLAEAAARVAAILVRVNLTVTAGDPRLAEADAAAAGAAAAAARAQGAL